MLCAYAAHAWFFNVTVNPIFASNTCKLNTYKIAFGRIIENGETENFWRWNVEIREIPEILRNDIGLNSGQQKYVNSETNDLFCWRSFRVLSKKVLTSEWWSDDEKLVWDLKTFFEHSWTNESLCNLENEE